MNTQEIENLREERFKNGLKTCYRNTYGLITKPCTKCPIGVKALCSKVVK